MKPDVTQYGMMLDGSVSPTTKLKKIEISNLIRLMCSKRIRGI